MGPSWAPAGHSWAPNGPQLGPTGAHLGMLLGTLIWGILTHRDLADSAVVLGEVVVDIHLIPMVGSDNPLGR